MISGIVVDDVSDHLPIFRMLERTYGLPAFKQDMLYKRVLTDDKIEMLYQNTDWSRVLMTQDTNISYDRFLEIFLGTYCKTCPIIKELKKSKIISKPWISPSRFLSTVGMDFVITISHIFRMKN